MKRIISFLILLALLICVLMQPAVEIPAAQPHPIPVWSVLCYLATVAAGALAAVWTNREAKPAAQTVAETRAETKAQTETDARPEMA